MKSRIRVIVAITVLVAICIAIPLVARNWNNLLEKFVPGAERVKRAQHSTDTLLKSLADAAGLKHPIQIIFLRAFKRERELEVWGADSLNEPMVLVKTYKIVALSGNLGPKRREGDKQVPEGCYKIAVFNPNSSFHLSLGLNYPNDSDRKREDSSKPGSDIYIHGDNRSVGCLAMTDRIMDEIYLLALNAKHEGLSAINVHIFPTRLKNDFTTTLEREFGSNPDCQLLWRELKPVFDAFELTRRVPRVEITSDGAYKVIQ